MNIRPVQLGTARPDTQASGPKSGPAARPAAAPTDRVELSGAHPANAPAQSAEPAALVEARQALGPEAPLDAERAAAIARRVEEGYYSQPEVLREVAERLLSDLGAPPERG